DCRHRGEPGCAVADAVHTGEVDAARLASLHRLEREVEFLERQSDPLANQEYKRKVRTLTRAYQKKKREDMKSETTREGTASAVPSPPQPPLSSRTPPAPHRGKGKATDLQLIAEQQIPRSARNDNLKVLGVNHRTVTVCVALLPRREVSLAGAHLQIFL